MTAPIGEWKPIEYPVGTVHRLNGYEFEQTLHGPNVERTCVGCGDRCYGTPEYPDPRCGDCWLVFVGVDLRAREALQQHPPKWLGSPPVS